MTPLRVAVIADYLEEGWPSMNLVAETIAATLQGQSGVQAELIRPPMPLRLQSVLGERGRNPDRLLARFWSYPQSVARLAKNFDVFHITDHSYSQLVHALPPGRCLVTCHDIDTFRCLLDPASDITSVPRPWWFRRMAAHILNGLRKAGHVACVSQSTANELRQTQWIEESRLSVIPNGVNEEYFGPVAPAQRQWSEDWLRQKGIASCPLLLHVGSTIERKRIDVLLEAFAAARYQLPNLQLLRVGGAFTPPQAALAERLGLLGAIHNFPFLDRSQLQALYCQASLVVQPSSYEGFGLPVAEAQASGAVVLASDIPVLREVGGDAAFFCPVGDIPQWSRQIIDLIELGTKDPARWQACRSASQHSARRFRWGEVANSLVYRYQYLAGLMG
jgi:glycosyltransferase involved in cell wall biosynthesis